MTPWGGTYSRLPHGFFQLDEVLEAGEKAALFLLRMSDFADRNMTDGRLSDRQAATLGKPKGVLAATRALSDVHLIERLEDDTGWQIVDWLDGHRSAEEMAEIREKRRSAGRKGGKARRKPTATAETNGKQVAKQDASDLLNPDQTRPDQSRPDKTPPPPGVTPRPADQQSTGGGGGPGSRHLVTTAIQRLRIADPDPPTFSEIRAIERCLERGHSPEELLEIADQAIRANADKPRAWTYAAWERMANTEAEARNASHDESCCGGSGLLEAAGGGFVQCRGSF